MSKTLRLAPEVPADARQRAPNRILPEQVVREMVSYGVLTPLGADTATWTFTTRSLVVVRKARRLQHDFELDTHAVTVVLRYLERIEALEAQLQVLRAQLG